MITLLVLVHSFVFWMMYSYKKCKKSDPKYAGNYFDFQIKKYGLIGGLFWVFTPFIFFVDAVALAKLIIDYLP